jgi:hypothetical protein
MEMVFVFSSMVADVKGLLSEYAVIAFAVLAVLAVLSLELHEVMTEATNNSKTTTPTIFFMTSLL